MKPVDTLLVYDANTVGLEGPDYYEGDVDIYRERTGRSIEQVVLNDSGITPLEGVKVKGNGRVFLLAGKNPEGKYTDKNSLSHHSEYIDNRLTTVATALGIDPNSIIVVSNFKIFINEMKNAGVQQMDRGQFLDFFHTLVAENANKAA